MAHLMVRHGDLKLILADDGSVNIVSKTGLLKVMVAVDDARFNVICQAPNVGDELHEVVHTDDNFFTTSVRGKVREKDYTNVGHHARDHTRSP